MDVNGSCSFGHVRRGRHALFFHTTGRREEEEEYYLGKVLLQGNENRKHREEIVTIPAVPTAFRSEFVFLFYEEQYSSFSIPPFSAVLPTRMEFE